MSLMWCEKCQSLYGPTGPCPTCGVWGSRAELESMSTKEQMDMNAWYVKFIQEKDIIKKFNLFLEMYCKDSYAHLIDSDENPGQEMRDSIELERLNARLEEYNYFTDNFLKLFAFDEKAHKKLLDHFKDLVKQKERYER